MWHALQYFIASGLIVVKDTEGRYLLINKSYETTFQMSREQLTGKTEHGVFPRAVAGLHHARERRGIS